MIFYNVELHHKIWDEIFPGLTRRYVLALVGIANKFFSYQFPLTILVNSSIQVCRDFGVPNPDRRRRVRHQQLWGDIPRGQNWPLGGRRQSRLCEYMMERRMEILGYLLGVSLEIIYRSGAAIKFQTASSQWKVRARTNILPPIAIVKSHRRPVLAQTTTTQTMRSHTKTRLQARTTVRSLRRSLKKLYICMMTPTQQAKSFPLT